MPYVKRDESNKVVGLYRRQQEFATEFLPESHDEVVAFRDPPAIIPAKVTIRQARLALLESGLLAQVDTAIASLPSPQKEAAAIEWEYATEVDRNSQLTKTLAGLLGLGDTELNNLFALAGAY